MWPSCAPGRSPSSRRPRSRAEEALGIERPKAAPTRSAKTRRPAARKAKGASRTTSARRAPAEGRGQSRSRALTREPPTSVTCVTNQRLRWAPRQGKFSTDIGDDVIAAAVESVEKQRETAAAEDLAASGSRRSQAEELARLRTRRRGARGAGARALDAGRTRSASAHSGGLADLDNARKRASASGRRSCATGWNAS